MCLVCGPSGSGKTTLVERLIPALARRGLPAATVKHHRGRILVDREGKDTWRHRRAGARATFLVTEGEVVAFFDRPPELDPASLARLCPPEVRILLIEGFKGLQGYPRIEVVRRGVGTAGPWLPEVLCAATDVEGLEAPFPVVGLDDVEAVADVLQGHCGG
ncbi:MAG: molybdopterin-guanine dinucleotide biosynthesis protein B [Deferrisomatales bacterium]|nr:molybdopterin-guanine dinucleotide biosynthesis protein B [Deferrisomatales bacterium]